MQPRSPLNLLLLPHQVLKEASKALFAPYCLVCGRPTAQSALCHGCMPPLPNKRNASRCSICFSIASDLNSDRVCELCQRLPSPFRSIRFLWPYADRARDLIQRMKYRPSKRLCCLAGGFLARSFPLLFRTGYWHALVPIPASNASLQERRFNQCALLAATLEVSLRATRKPVPLLSLFALKHKGCKAPQASLNHSLRLTNVAYSFQAEQKEVSGRRILLIDDVITTGATSAAAAIALLEAGAKSVDLLALARSDAWQEYRFRIFECFSKNNQRKHENPRTAF